MRRWCWRGRWADVAAEDAVSGAVTWGWHVWMGPSCGHPQQLGPLQLTAFSAKGRTYGKGGSTPTDCGGTTVGWPECTHGGPRPLPFSGASLPSLALILMLLACPGGWRWSYRWRSGACRQYDNAGSEQDCRGTVPAPAVRRSPYGVDPRLATRRGPDGCGSRSPEPMDRIDANGRRHRGAQPAGPGQPTRARRRRAGDLRLLQKGGRLWCPGHNLIPDTSLGPNHHRRNARAGGRHQRIHHPLHRHERTDLILSRPKAPSHRGRPSFRVLWQTSPKTESARSPLTTRTSASTSARSTGPSTAASAGSGWRRARCAALRCRRSRGRCPRGSDSGYAS